MPDESSPHRSGAGGETKASLPGAVRDLLEERRAEMVALLVDLVAIESPSDDPAGLDRMATRLQELFGWYGSIATHPVDQSGARHLVLTIEGDGVDASDGHDSPSDPAVVLAHYDTVWPRGTLERLPARAENEVVRGPGCFDMKGGLVLLFFALDALRTVGRGPRRLLRVFFSCDEEVGSTTSRDLIHELVADAGVAYVLEAPLPGGMLKTARKGTGNYRVTVEGRAAHAGIEPEKGISAIVELAHQVQAIHGLNDPAKGTTLNVGVVRGGTRGNVVAAHAEAEVNVRATTIVEAERVHTALLELQPVLPGAKVSVVREISRPPMERTEATGRLFERAREIAANAGIAELTEGATGGASDGNFAAAAGVPTLDGLGPEGGGAHADTEHVLIESLPRRAALLAGLLAEV